MVTNYEMLRKHEPFNDLNEDFLHRLAEKAVEAKFSKGDVLIAEFSEVTDTYFVIEGEVRAETLLADRDHSQEPSILEAGSVLGMMSLFGVAVPAVTLIAESDLRVLRWAPRDWVDLCEADPANGYRLAANVGKMSVIRLRKWGNQILNQVSWGLGM